MFKLFIIVPTNLPYVLFTLNDENCYNFCLFHELYNIRQLTL